MSPFARHPDDHTDQWTAGALAEYVHYDWRAFCTIDVSAILPPPTLPHGVVIDAEDVVPLPPPSDEELF